MAKKVLSVYVESEIIEDLERIAKASHMDKNSYAALWVSRLSELKVENGLIALTTIPKDLFRGRGGRPATTNRADTSDNLTLIS